ncbi:MAG TPA: LuxR C-terminal-related transcriptional regulator [Thermoanaerobaculia bacterium]|nr:LuxR C-terminal-related transcriptional regulator [Thermoanaerobaculia bacterium]
MNDTIAFEVDPDNRITSWSAEAEALFGRDRAAAEGRSWVELLAARDAVGNRLCEQSCALHAMARAGETIGVFELIATDVAGASLRLFACAQPLGTAATQGLRFLLWQDRRRGSLERRRGAKRPKECRPGHSPLTPRETEVLRLLSRGLTVEEIGERLGIAVTTVRNHAQRLLPKLGASSRVEAVALAIRRGLL